MKLLVILVLLAGCTSVKVVKVTPGGSEPGLRYALGKPFIKVTPNANGDGGYAAELIYLPDENQTYGVQVHTFLTKYTMELNVDDAGILQKVNWSKTAASPSSEAISAFGDIVKSEMERRNEEADKKQTQLKEEAKAIKTELDKTNEALAQKQIEFNAAIKEKESLETNYPAHSRSEAIREKIRAIEVTMAKLDSERAHLQAKVTRLMKSLNNIADASNAVPGAKAYGPVLFDIKETVDASGKLSLSLEAVKWQDGKLQRQFESPSKPAEITPEVTAVPRLISEIYSTSFDNKGEASVKLSFTQPVSKMDQNQSQLSDENNVFAFTQITSKLSGKDLSIKFQKTKIPPGTYQLKLDFIYLDDDKNEKAGVANAQVTLK